MAKDYVLALDQGTTSSRAIVFGRDGRAAGVAQQEYDQIYPFPGHVEHNPEQIWNTQRDVAVRAIQAAGLTAGDIAAIGVTNQRETTILWEKSTGKPVANAIVWQSRITADYCDRLKSEGLAETFRNKTGLVIDAYFSGTKIRHLLDNIPGLRAKAEAGEILFGTVDTFLLWRLSGGRLHVTDHSNASRTLIFNIHTLDWDDELLRILNIPRIMLPQVRPSSEIYGETDLFGAKIPLAGNAGDQQAATFGQACFQPGDIKNTYGTGCFMLLNTGTTAVRSEHGLLTTIGWKLGENEPPVYCLEGSVFIAGAVIQWLRDELRLIDSAAESEQLAQSVPDTGGVYLVPAFAGLGAPHWNQNARGTIVGITRGASRAHIVRAAVESMAYQSADLAEAMKQDAGLQAGVLKVDGGACANNFLMQFQADLLDQTVQRPQVQETTALGAAYLAGLATGVWSDLSDIRKNWNLDREFTPNMPPATRDRLQRKWKQAVQRSLDWRSAED